MNSILRGIFLFYFISHIPATIFVDFQAIFGRLYPETLRNFFSWYTSNYHDFLMASPPLWLKSFIFAEALFQFPFFFFAIYCLWYKKNMIRIPGIIYGIHVSTTLIPILSEFYTSRRLRNSERNALLGFYLPYLIIPFMFAMVLSVNPYPFPHRKSKSSKE
jgi:hypothetical protein